VSNIVFALGLSGEIPIVFSAWTPASVTLMLGIAVLLHLEDG
jgi:lipopolysaccharide export system permease protein